MSELNQEHNGKFCQQTTNIGKIAEQLAATYLVKQGLSVIDKNFNARCGELDLIMQDQQTLVFVEVKYRRNSHYGGAISAISLTKQKKVKQTAAFYLQQQQLNAYNTDHRFDVVALEGDPNNPEINWLKNAF